ncbi:hypothetical protein ZEAMMB73_Zm00001d021076, partial [Zea mays]
MVEAGSPSRNIMPPILVSDVASVWLTISRRAAVKIAALRLQLENKDREVERLKDLCLRHWEEIRTLKDVVLFLHVEPEPEPDRRLQDDISTLTDRIQCLAQELAQEAEKHSARSCFDEDGYCSSPRTPGFNEDTAFSLECNIGKLRRRTTVDIVVLEGYNIAELLVIYEAESGVRSLVLGSTSHLYSLFLTCTIYKCLNQEL